MDFGLKRLQKKSSAFFVNPTFKAFVLTKIFSAPFWGIFDLLPLILCRELHASAFEITTIIALKPLSAVFSVYWSSRVYNNRHRLLSNIVWANILKFSPFIIAPLFTNPWVYIVAFGFHMFLLRGIIPSWMEILKSNVSKANQSKACAIGTVINYIGTAILPLTFGWLLDNLQSSWRWIFPVTGLMGVLSTWFIYKIPKVSQNEQNARPRREGLKKEIIKPWKTAWELLIKRSDFLRFQIGFFLGGAGLMIIHAVLPKYFSEDLKLSYTSVLFATSLCKGLGVTLSSPFWVKLFNRTEIFSFCYRIPLIAAIFPLFLILAHLNPIFLFVAYLLYGIMQGGSELGWKMSGPVFSNESDSSPYSSINVLAVGLRGAIFPYFGAIAFFYGGSYLTLMLGGVVCLSGGLFLWFSQRKIAQQVVSEPF